MLNFSSLLNSNNKKIFVTIFLFLVVFGLVFPKTSYAFDWACPIITSVSSTLGTALCGANELYNITTNSDTTIMEKALDTTVGQAAKYVYDSMLAAQANFILWVAWGIAQGTSTLFSIIVASVLDWKITTDVDYIAGWTSVRDLANMLIVLGFVLIGIAFTLRIEGYGSKIILRNLILIAILINFSNVFCGLIIDGSNLTMKSLLGQNAIAGSIGGSLMTDIVKYQDATLTKDMITAKGIPYYLGTAAFIAAFYIFLAITLFYVGVLFIARYVILGILFVLSPLAFAFWIFPATKNLWTTWWNNFIKWAFIGVGGCFFINLAERILVGGSTTLFRLFVVMVFMIIGMKIVTKSSGLGATAVIGLAGAAASMALTGGASIAATGGMAALNKLTGGRASAVKENITAGAGRVMENFGLRQRGTTDTAVNKQVEEKAKLTSAAYAAAKARNDQFTINRIQKDAKTKRGSEGAAAMKAITDAKDLREVFKDPSGKFDALSANSRLVYAESAGAKDLRKDALKLNPELAKFNRPSDEAINKILTEHTPQGGTTIRDAEGIAAAKKIFSADEVSGAYKKATVADIRNYSKEVLSSKEFFENVKANKIAKAAQEMSSEGVDAIKSNIAYAQQEMKKCYLPGGKTLDPAKSARYKELQEKLKELSIM